MISVIRRLLRGVLLLALILLSIGVASAASVRLAVTAASVDTSVCPANPTPVRNFSTTSTAAFLYYVLDNVAAGDTVSVSWLDPTGKIYAPAGASYNVPSSGAKAK